MKAIRLKRDVEGAAEEIDDGNGKGIWNDYGGCKHKNVVNMSYIELGNILGEVTMGEGMTPYGDHDLTIDVAKDRLHMTIAIIC